MLSGFIVKGSSLPKTSLRKSVTQVCWITPKCYARKPRERNSGEIIRRHGRRMWRKFGGKLRRFSSFNFQKNRLQDISRKILSKLNGPWNKTLSPRDSGSLGCLPKKVLSKRRKTTESITSYEVWAFELGVSVSVRFKPPGIWSDRFAPSMDNTWGVFHAIHILFPHLPEIFHAIPPHELGRDLVASSYLFCNSVLDYLFSSSNSVQIRCITKGEAQKSPHFWRFSGGCWFSQVRVFSRNSSMGPLKFKEIASCCKYPL